MSKVKNSTTYEDDRIHMYLEDDVFHTFFKPGIVITKELTLMLTKERLRICAGNDYPHLGDFRFVRKWTSAAKLDGVASEGTFDNIYAGALVFDSIIMKVAWEFIYKVFGPAMPMKTFSDVDEAKNWCLEQRKEQLMNS